MKKKGANGAIFISVDQFFSTGIIWLGLFFLMAYQALWVI